MVTEDLPERRIKDQAELVGDMPDLFEVIPARQFGLVGL
jgi:hypothetical protein